MFIKRSVQPGYDTGFCSPDVVEAVNCEFAKQVYAIYAKERYGVDQCIGDGYDDAFIKKELLDLNLIYDPTLCKRPPCPKPCHVTASIFVFHPSLICERPRNVLASIVVLSSECPEPSGVTAEIIYDTGDVN